MKPEPLEDCEILLVINASERYSLYAEYLCSEQASRLPEPNSWDHQIRLQHPNTIIPTGSMDQTTWEEDEAPQKYLLENISIEKVRHSHSAANALVLFV